MKKAGINITPPKRYFKGIWISRLIWLTPALNFTEKIFLAEIDSLSSEDRGCYVTNKHFAKFFKLTSKYVSVVISGLIKKGLVISKIDKQKGNKRELWIDEPRLTKLLTAIPKNRDRVSRKIGIGYPEESGEVSGKNRIGHNKDENKTKTNTLIVEKTVEDETAEISSQKKLALVLRKATGYELALHHVLPARTRSERTTYNRLKEYLIQQILDGKLKLKIFNDVLEWAKESKNISDTPRRMFIAKCKEETGFVGTGGKFFLNRKLLLGQQVRQITRREQ
jgi:hypothetical protein